MNKLLRGSLLAAVVGCVTFPAAAHTTVDFSINVAPPAPYYEPVPVARPGWVWAPGYWDWRGHHHYWVAGHWVRARPGYVYNSPHWYASGGHWYLDHGGWRAALDADRYAYNLRRYP